MRERSRNNKSKNITTPKTRKWGHEKDSAQKKNHKKILIQKEYNNWDKREQGKDLVNQKYECS
jgi:hypothetical protein